MNDQAPKEMDKGQKIAKGLVNLLEEKTGVPVHFIDNEVPKKVFDVIKSDAKIRKHLSAFSDDELYREIADFFSTYSIFSKPEERNEATFLKKLSEFIDSLGKENTYESFIFIPGIYEFPNVQFGELFETINYDTVKNKPHLKDHVARIIKDVKDISKEDIEHGLWIKFIFKTPHTREVVKYTKEALQPYIGVISLLCFGFQIKLDLLLGVINGEKRSYLLEPQYLEQGRIRKGWARFPSDNEEIKARLDRITEILNKSSKKQVEKKLLLFAKLYLLSLQSDAPEIKLVILISALETLLLAEYDQYYIGEKTAEKTALILGRNYTERKKLHKFIKSQYKARSNFVHKGESVIKAQDIRNLESVCEQMFFKILKLSEAYSVIAGDKGLDAMIMKMKFEDSTST